MDRRSAKVFVPLLVSALTLNPVAFAFAETSERTRPTFAELVRNTKETDSVLLDRVTPTDLDEDGEPDAPIFRSDDARADAGIRAAFEDVAKSMAPVEGALPPEACEPALLSRLQIALQAEGLRADVPAIRAALVRLREINLIDDLALLPMLAAYPAWAELGYRAEEWTRKDSEGRVAILDCPTGQYLQLVASVKTALGRKMKRKDLVKRIDAGAKEKNDAGEPRYLAVQIAWLKALERADFDGVTSFALDPVLKQVAEAKDASPRADANDRPTKVMSKKKKKTGGLSNRLALYATYNGFQINLLADEFKKFVERMDMLTATAKIVITYKDGRPDETYDLSPQEQYRMAAKMLHKEIEELKLSGLFAGKNPTFDDVIVASVETGFIHASELDAAMGVDDIWNPKVSGWTKLVNVLKKYGATALVLIPNPFSFWASLAITLAETAITKKTQGPGDADDHGISIF